MSYSGDGGFKIKSNDHHELARADCLKSEFLAKLKQEVEHG